MLKKNNLTITTSVGNVRDKQSVEETFQYLKSLKVKCKKEQVRKLSNFKSWSKNLKLRTTTGKTQTIPRFETVNKHILQDYIPRFETVNKHILQDYISLILTDVTLKGVLSGKAKVSKHIFEQRVIIMD